MSTYIGLTIGGLMLTVLHLEFAPSSTVKDSPYKVELKVMLKACVEAKQDDCDAIKHVLAKAR